MTSENIKKIKKMTMEAFGLIERSCGQQRAMPGALLHLDEAMQKIST
jgi:hypothetical protein